MTDKEDIFLTTLYNQYPDIYQMALKKKYKVLVPLKRCLIETMLNRNFYDNHIYQVSKYDESMYVNLNGKVLKLEHQKFTSYLGWKKDMEFLIKEEFIVDQDLSCIQIDNVCDDSNYNKTTVSTKDVAKSNNIKRFTTMNEYIEHYNTKTFDYSEFEKAYDYFELKTDLLRNNIIFMRNHEDEYAIYFNKEVKEIQENFKNALAKWKPNASLDTLVAELVDSLVFNKMYDYIFDNLVEFHKDEEIEMKNKIKEFPGKYDIAAMQVDKAYRDCKFEKAIEQLKEITDKHNIFEKLVLLTEINSKIAEEAKEAYEREDAKNYYSPESDVLLNFWSYVISHADVPNILAESAFLKNFNFIGYAYGEASYLATTFVTAVETIFRDNVKEDPYKASAAQNILKSEIKTTKVDILGKKSRDRSQTSAVKRATKLGGA